MARAQGARAQIAAVFETTYGLSPASGFYRMPFASSTLGTDQPLLDSELLGFGRDPRAPIRDAITADGDLVVPLDPDSFGVWLKAAFGDPTTTGEEAPYTHVFASGALALPSMSIEVGMPEVPDFTMYAGCRVDTLSWQMQRSGLLTTRIGLVAQGDTPASSTQAGTLSSFADTRFGHFNGAISRNGAALANIVSAEISYSNTLDRIETIRADGKIDGADPSVASLRGSLEARFADQTLMDQALAGQSCALSFSYSLAAGVSFTFVAHEVYLPRPRKEVSGPGGVQVRFDWQAAWNQAAGRMCTATLVNAVAGY